MIKRTDKDKINEWNGKITPTNEWYRCPKHCLYYSSNACFERIKQDDRAAKTAATKKFNKANKEAVEASLGIYQAALVVERIQCLISDYDYGIGSPTHINYKGKGWASPLTKSQILNHLAGQKTIYYTAQPHQIGGMSLVMVTIDIDNPKHVNNSASGAALRASKKIQRDMKKLGASVLVQPSTNENGYHLTFCISFHPNARHNTIRNHLAELRSAIATKYESYGCHEICLKGINFSTRMMKGTVYGTLVRLPLITNLEESGAFLAMTESPVKFSALSDFYSLSVDKEDQDKEKAIKNSSDSSQANNTDSDSSKRQSRLLIEEQATGTRLISCGDKTPFLSQKLRNGKHEWNEKDPLGRMFKAASAFCHEHKRLPNDAKELVSYYESLGLNTDKANPERMKRAKKALAWVTKNHSFSIPSESTLYKKWLKHFTAKNYSREDLTYTTGRFIRVEHLALVASIIERKELQAHQRGITKEYFLKISREKKARGDIGFVLDNKKFAFCIKLLVEEEVIEIVENRTLREGARYSILMK